MRGIQGSHARSRILADARSLGLPVQVNSTLTRHTVGELDALAEMRSPGVGAVMWACSSWWPWAGVRRRTC
ncbi:MAG: hypothetical protein U0Y82_08835 [Thermoleophilia bacterium]